MLGIKNREVQSLMKRKDVRRYHDSCYCIRRINKNGY